MSKKVKIFTGNVGNKKEMCFLEKEMNDFMEGVNVIHVSNKIKDFTIVYTVVYSDKPSVFYIPWQHD